MNFAFSGRRTSGWLGLLTFAFGLVGWTPNLVGAPIPTLYNSGAGITYNALNFAQRIPDPNWQVVLESGSIFTPVTLHGPIGIFPATGPIPPWLGDSDASKWLSFAPSGNASPGTYVFRTGFSLTDFDPTTLILKARVAVDNALVAVRINGTEIAATANSFTAWTDLDLSHRFFPFYKRGANILEFVVRNDGTTVNPCGFRAEFATDATRSAAPVAALGNWSFDDNAGVPPLLADTQPLVFSSDTVSGVGRSLKVQPPKNFATSGPTGDQLVTLGDLTLAAWIRPMAPAASAGGEIVFGFGGAGGNKLWLAPGRRLAFTVYGVQDVISDVVFPIDGLWHHIAAVHHDGSSVDFYVDGVVRDSKVYTAGLRLPATRVLSVGYEGDYAQPFNGLIDDINIIPAAVSPGSYLKQLPRSTAFAGRANGTTGTRFLGSLPFGVAGRAVRGAGDMNGDGIDDVLVGDYQASAVDLIFGTTTPVGSLTRGSLNGTNGVRIVAPPFDFGEVLAVGDFNGDGYGDFATRYSNGTGEGVYIIFGRSAAAWKAVAPNGVYDLGVGLSPASEGRPADQFFTGTANEPIATGNIENGLAGVGDVDGDGIDDLVISAGSTVYLVYGSPTWPSSTTALKDYSLATRLFTRSGGFPEGPGTAGAGDVNGDGLDDILISNGGANEVWLIYGQRRVNGNFPDAPLNENTASGTNASGQRRGLKFVDRTHGVAGLGMTLAGLGDANGDGLDDIAIGYHRADGALTPTSGRVYLVFGAKNGPSNGIVDLSAAPGNGLATVINSNLRGSFGLGLGSGGDLNGDGLADLAFGSGFLDGRAILRYGAANLAGISSLTLPESDTGAEGFLIAGPDTRAVFGWSVAPAGDFNGDGLLDLVVGAPAAQGTVTDPDASGGEAYIHFGTKKPSTATSSFYLASGENQSTLDGISVPPRAAGHAGDGSTPSGFTRVAVGFKGGANSGGKASKQTVTLRRFGPPTPQIGGTLTVAPVSWFIRTEDRANFSASDLVFQYLPSEFAGLDPAKADVWYTSDENPGPNSAWSPLGAKHLAAQHRFVLHRGHSKANAAAQFNGTYAIFAADLIYPLGSEIPVPAVVDVRDLPATGPIVEGDPQNPLAVWDSDVKKLYAVRPGSVVVRWTTVFNELRATTVATLVWPDAPQLQPHFLGTPPVVLTNYDVVQLTATETDASATDTSTQRQFVAGTPGRSLLRLTKNGVGTRFLPVVSRRWDDPPALAVSPIVIGQEALPPQGVQDPEGPSPQILTTRARYCVAPGYYTPATGGAIFPVNTADPADPQTTLAVAYYQRTTLGTLTKPNGIYPPTFWPGLAIRFEASWPPVQDPIVIASQFGAGTLDPAVYGPDWKLYFQNDRSKPGFNPNDEHARVAANAAGKTTLMPLRSDLGHPTNSLPFVLMTYTVPGSLKPALKVFPVVATSPAFPEFRSSVVAGKPVLPPLPFATDPICTNNFDQAIVDGVPVAQRFLHQDRKKGMWAKAGAHDGVGTSSAVVRFFYPVRDEFFFPAFYPAPANRCVPLLDLAAGTPGVPMTTRVTISWPSNPTVLHIPESLVDPKRGLPAIDVPPNPDGTPGVGGPCSVSIIYDQATAQNPANRIVTLVDPLKEHTVAMGKLPDGMLTEIVQGKLRFKGLPPHLHPRITYQQTNDNGGLLKLAGVYFNEPGNAEGSYFLPNVLSASEVAAVLSLAPGNSAWATAVNTLAATARADLPFTQADRGKTLLALSSGLATGSGWITLTMQDFPEPVCDEDLPVSLEVFKVTGPYRGEVATIAPADVFDERLTFKHKADFAGDPDQWFFEWRLQPVGVSEELPPVGPNDPIPTSWQLSDAGAGRVTLTIGGASPFTLGDNRVIVRFRPLNATTRAMLATSSNPQGWSDWTEPKLGQGWVKRVLAGINPYEQRFRDLSDPSRQLNTTVSMLAQAGHRWEGNVPLNSASTDAFGLIEIYETVFRRARALSVEAGINYQPANDALLLAASRLSDLYMLLGNDAYADAADPTLTVLDTSDPSYVNFAPTLHAFQGLAQAGDLLLEELVLLRGRDNSAEPSVQRPPFYNRFPWNFSSDLGRVAYMANYDIRDAQGRIDGVINAQDAQFYYPQGHGDAWGHYLTALGYYYQLARNPFFTWIPRSELDEISGIDVRVDYQEEQKFVRAAAAKARTGAEVVNLTYRDRFTEDPAGQWQGYKDADRERAWGVSDWGARAGQGAYFDWVLGNALLPEAGARPPIEGVRAVDRGTQPDLSEITAASERIQNEVDKADRGLNPLGLERNVMPFDISVSAADGNQTHFEQIYERAVKALSSAVATFYYAASNTQRLRTQSDSLDNFQKESRAQEIDYQSRLIEIFGQPYREDIGPGGIYPAGYNGPDYLHYDYIDPSTLLGIARDPNNLALQQRTVTIAYTADPFVFASNGSLNVGIGQNGLLSTQRETIPFTVTDLFGITRPSAWTDRLSTGELQTQRSTLLQAIGAYRTRLQEYNNLIQEIEAKADLIEAQYNVNRDTIQIQSATTQEVIALNAGIATARITSTVLQTAGDTISGAANATAEALPIVVGVDNDVTSTLRGAAMLVGLAADTTLTILANLADGSATAMEAARDNTQLRSDLKIAQIQGSFALQESLNELQTLVRNESVLRYDLMTQLEGIHQQVAGYQTTITRGQRLLEEFKRFRFETSEAVSRARYKDMAYRVFRDDALQKYRGQFDLAARYVYLAARAYDYETAFLPGDRRGAGAAFLNQVVRSRVIGNMKEDGGGLWTPFVGGLGDAGLADSLARLNQNWDLNLKSQLGFNNPQPDVTRFSLRYDLFQMLPHGDPASDAVSDQAWRELLSSPGIRVANVLGLEAFNRYCIPFAPRDEINGEPALVIPFSTTINAGQNFFGNPLVENQDQFDSTKFANKIRGVKVLFEGLSGAGLTSQPLVYLIPVGTDILRSPSDPRNLATREFIILDQALPVPFPLNYQSGGVIPSSLTQPGWIPSIDGLSGQPGAIRRYGSLKAYDANVGGDALSSTRLVGRSAWNTRWLLIIPGRTLFTNPTEGIERFINGRIIDSSTGARDGKGITDIRLELETYSVPGL